MVRFAPLPRLVIVVSLAMTSLLVLPAARAGADTTITVTTQADGGAGSLREAINAANASGTPVTIVLAAGLIYDLTTCGAAEDANVSGDLDLTAAVGVSIDGNDSTIRQTCTNARVFDHHGPGGLVLDSVTLTGGNFNSFPNPGNEGAGLGIRSASSIAATHLTVTGNVGAGSGSRDGAAVYLAGTLGASFDLSSISSNSSAGLYDAGTGGADLTITRSTISDNVGTTLSSPATQIRPSNGVTVESRRLNITDSTLERNTGPTMPVPPPTWPPANGCCSGVGALSVPVDNIVTKLYGARLVIRNNAGFRATVYGGKIELYDSLVEDNWSGAAGGVGGFMELHRVTIRGNNAPIGGGGIAGHGVVEDSTISGNQSGPYANAAAGHGGGIVVDGPMTVRRSTITGNSAGNAGGIHVSSDFGNDPADPQASLALIDSTVADNVNISRPEGPHEIALQTSTPPPSATVTRSVVSHQVGAGAACATNGYTFGSNGSNVVSDLSCFATPQPTDLNGTSTPLLAPLAANGGPTKTRMPAAGSPLVDRIPAGVAGCTGAFDQRGVARPQGPGCDVGATEARKAGYHPVSPVRIVDTRTGQGTTAQKLGPGESRSFSLPPDVDGRAAAVVLNVTAANPTAASHLTLWPSGSTRPVASNLNFPALQNVAGLTTVATGTTNKPVSVFNNAGSTDVIVDLAGWYDNGIDDGAPASPAAASPADQCPCGDGFTALSPTRVLDTRPGTTVGGPASPFGPGETRTLQIAGVQGIPAGATAVAINLTVTGATSSSHLTVWPTATIEPTVSNLNWPARSTIANLAIVKLGPDGALKVRNNQGTVDVIADVAGVYTSGPGGARFTVVSPRRILDTRETGNPLGAGIVRTIASPAIPDGATAAVVELTGVGPTADTHLTAWPTGAPLPVASNLNLPAGTTRANLTTIALDPGARFDLRNNPGTMHVVADLAGYYG